MAARPRIGFLGVGWIGRSRLEAIAAQGGCEIVAVAEPADDMAHAALALAPGAARVEGLDGLLALNLDGVAIATPSAQHAEQSTRALQAGAAVFCQKPLGRSAAETAGVVQAARTADRLLAVDLSYRFTQGGARIRELVRSGGIGPVFAADLVFHNAYGPDKPWFYDRAQSGGGCVIDLGVHLVDLALWTLDWPQVVAVESALYAAGERLAPGDPRVEDYAVATLQLEGGATVRLACSWRLHAGREAVIAAEFHGLQGGAALSNVDGSFYDFAAERRNGTAHEPLATPPDAWGGRAAAEWARRLARGDRYDAEAERLVEVAGVLDRIYAG